MRAILHFRNSGLSPQSVMLNFKSFYAMGTASSVLALKLNDNAQDAAIICKLSEVVASHVPTFRPESISEINTYFNTQSNHKRDLSEDLLFDRYAQQMNVIEQVSHSGEDSSYSVASIRSEAVEITVHSCLNPLKRELQPLFPDRPLSSDSSILTAICINHHTQAAMSVWDAAVASERESLATQFVTTARELCSLLTVSGFWADFIDPQTGKPWFGGVEASEDRLLETDGRLTALGLSVTDLGCCQVLCHPSWGPHVLAGLLFTDAPPHHPLLSALGGRA